ncbi:hypothetical protein GH714_018305 [Hevea brasiliensis]|uniref:Uncharacterized protein n=1 Tax=Hevea brasiliensis TaxID=3981 RepID=A0A6A6LYD0_HEVBR|nr:hypothetical protein GH714_018305 [Hevea brasiliensis]
MRNFVPIELISIIGLISSVFIRAATPVFGLIGVWTELFLFMNLMVLAGIWSGGGAIEPSPDKQRPKSSLEAQLIGRKSPKTFSGKALDPSAQDHRRAPLANAKETPKAQAATMAL